MSLFTKAVLQSETDKSINVPSTIRDQIRIKENNMVDLPSVPNIFQTFLNKYENATLWNFGKFLQFDS